MLGFIEMALKLASATRNHLTWHLRMLVSRFLIVSTSRAVIRQNHYYTRTLVIYSSGALTSGTRVKNEG